MNVLVLVFSILLIFTYGYYAIWDKYTSGIKLRKTYLAHQEAHREVLNQFESKFYNDSLHRAKPQPPAEEKKEREEAGETINEKEPGLNRECARLNLWPLIQEGKESHPILYEMAAHLIRTFYGPLNQGKKKFEYRLLNLWLASAKQAVQNEGECVLEKVALRDPDMQKIYYKMLKGTKKWDLRASIGYPPLMEYVKVDPSETKICVFHAHPDLLSVIFNPKLAWKLYHEIHRQDGPVLTQTLVERIASETHTFLTEPDLFLYLQLTHYLDHKDKNVIFTADVGGVSLRKKLTLGSVKRSD